MYVCLAARIPRSFHGICFNVLSQLDCSVNSVHLGWSISICELKTSSSADSSFTSSGCHKISPVGISETGKTALLVGASILVCTEPKGEDSATVPSSAWKTDRLKWKQISTGSGANSRTRKYMKWYHDTDMIFSTSGFPRNRQRATKDFFRGCESLSWKPHSASSTFSGSNPPTRPSELLLRSQLATLASFPQRRTSLRWRWRESYESNLHPIEQNNQQVLGLEYSGV